MDVHIISRSIKNQKGDVRLNELPKETVMRLAYEKALDVANRNRNSLVIGADTIVVINDTILGKPKDDIEAFRKIRIIDILCYR